MLHKPMLFVDIDGVISLWGFKPNTCPPGRWHVVDGVLHFLSTTAAEALQRLSGDFDLVWCSGWEEKADEHLPHALDLPRGLPHLSFDRPVGGRSAPRAHWKLQAIDDHAGDRPLAWIDDALNDACHAWAAARRAPTLLVVTEPAAGLGGTHVEALRAFAAQLPSAAARNRRDA
jgi:hypothetical protein